MVLITYPVSSVLHKGGSGFGSTYMPEAYREDHLFAVLESDKNNFTATNSRPDLRVPTEKSL
jgi:hypothetical protein